jgi:F-type H+-transporting ATPase subunit gamma
MANVLDLRRRIRSIKNTRQITKAMKMVAAAKLRRAQERMMSSRPYVTMMESVLQSLKRHSEIYDPETGDVRHPLLLTRPEKNVLVLVVSGEGGFAGAFNANIVKAAIFCGGAIRLRSTRKRCRRSRIACLAGSVSAAARLR